MELFVYLFGGIVALVLLFSIAEPYRFLPEKERKVKVGANYWGFYEGTDADVKEEEKTIEVKRSTRKEKTAYGATTYAQGRGVSMRGA